ncbi:tetratricopeptide repeat protein [Hyphococcus flavus]|uniref:Tetratricopeptide repeat protein 38 n=1 Tax=Hyphococcus flavus TaxID=1866326 RepID=A0AAE9ZHK8_9PROT|nr:tetratricopeptide repeat protein [Hyphococcus flavus]WDI33228.1 tetratricopeptide repeat protein [Hyphococcus flavus]
MSVRDCFDLPLTATCAASARGYDDYVSEFLSYGSNIRGLFEVADANEGSALVNAHAAALHLAFEGAEGWAAANQYLERMRAHEESATERERLFCSAVNAWAAQDFCSALVRLDELTVRWPADLCAIKWGQYHAFNLGDQAALLRLGQRAAIVHEETPYAHGMIAFALEQNHRLREAEEEGMRASEIAIDDAWAHHAVAHVLETEGRAKEGARWLDHCAHTWEKKGVFIRDHNWWHAALFQLALGRETEALEIFDERLWGAWPEFPQEQIGAVSMLWRLELRGVDVGERWAPVVEQARQRAGEHFFPFHDLHYLYALARAGTDGEADAFLSSLKLKEESVSEDTAYVWGKICFPAAEAIVAFTANDRDAAAEKLSPLLNDLHRIGGSHAQRHVFVETLEACTNASSSAAQSH